MQVIEYADRAAAARGLADQMADGLRAHLQAGGPVTLAVPGGTTPGPVFDLLCAEELAWDRVTILLTDERWVPDTHERSNAGLIRERLLQGPAAQAQFIPFYKAGITADAATEVLSSDLSGHLPLSVLVLGMGADMHTASLFPEAQGLAAALHPDAPAVCAITTDSQPEPRITLSAPVLNGALDKHLVIFGDDKRQALKAAMELEPAAAPISAVIQGGTVHWAP